MSVEDFIKAPVADAPRENPNSPSNDQKKHAPTNANANALVPLDGEILPSAEQQRRTPSALRGTDLNEIQSRAQLIRALTENIPMNDYGMPTIIYRTDMLDHTVFQSDSDEKYRAMQEMLQASTIHINFDEGFPALPSGKPLWDQLEFEPNVAYTALLKYLEMPGARKLSLLAQVPPETAREWFHLYYWGLRAKAYDTFQVAHYERQREQRILNTTDKHFLESQALIDKVISLKNDLDWEALKDPEKWINVLEKLVKIQRVAIGLPAHGNAPAGSESKVQSLELIMRRIANRDGTGETQKAQDVDTSNILSSLDDIEAAQELIIRVGSSK